MLREVWELVQTHMFVPCRWHGVAFLSLEQQGAAPGNLEGLEHSSLLLPNNSFRRIAL